MASTISAGTTSGTALAMAGDTSGALVLQTNGTTTAVTISTAQVVTLAQPLPVASGGTGVATSTGTGANVLGTSPTLTTPTFDSASLVTISGTAPLYMCRAWVNFNGTGTVAIRASGNVSSITDQAVGVYKINFSTAMPDASYALAGSVLSSASGGRNLLVSSANSSDNASVADPSTSGVWIKVISTAATAYDEAFVTVTIFR